VVQDNGSGWLRCQLKQGGDIPGPPKSEMICVL
jgi:hypothetical protein